MRSLDLRTPRDAAGFFTNWSETVRSQPRRWCEPTNETELALVVRTAARRGERVRVVGAGHSWSPIAAPAPDETAVSLDRMQGVIALDRGRSLATVQAGARIAQLSEELAREGLALPILGSIAHQSIAGAIATATHGSSLVHGNLSSLVEGARLVTGAGDLLDLDASDPRLDGVRVHLGALGILARVTLRVCPAFQLAETVEAIPIASVPPALSAIARSAEYVKVWWIPQTPSALVYRYERTEDPTSSRPSPQTIRYVDDVVMHGKVFPLLVAFSRRRPRFLPALARIVAGTLSHRRRVGPSHVMLSTPMPVLHRETEAALPLDAAGEGLARIIARTERERFRVLFPLEVRFVRGDTGWMSPASGRDTCQIGAYATDGPDADPYFAAFWRELGPMGARPHWGKEMAHFEGEASALYPAGGRFLALRDALDPERRFSGPFHTRLLGS
jgi:FAD/FMN-containing dehydrogenase